MMDPHQCPSMRGREEKEEEEAASEREKEQLVSLEENER